MAKARKRAPDTAVVKMREETNVETEASASAGLDIFFSC